MKKIVFVFLLISTTFYAQNYEQEWDKVIKHEQEGKIKSANAIISKIHRKAVEDKNDVQIIKCFFYESKYLQVLEENAQSTIINNLQKEIQHASIPSNALLNLIYAKCLNDFYIQNYYRRQSITPTDNPDSNFLTWSNAEFQNQIARAYNKSRANETVLKNTPLTKYEAIFDFFTLEKFKNENLFDYLLKENITFYKSKINVIDSKRFQEYKNVFLGKTTNFTKLDLDFIEDKNLKKILGLQQKLELDVPENQLERLLFCNAYLIKSDDDLLKALNDLEKETIETINLQKIQLEKANIYANSASKNIHPDYNIKAIAELERVLALNNNSNAYKQALQKKEILFTKNTNVEFQKYLYHKENSRAFIRYRNTNNVTISFFKISHTKTIELENSKNPDSVAFKIIENKKNIVTKNYKLVDKKDYFEYTTEVLLPQLETGSYLVYFESETDSKDTKGFGYETITVSNISVLANEKENTEYYTVLDRKTGKPMENVALKSYYFDLKTNAQGLATYKPNDSIKNYDTYYPIVLTTKNDTILIDKKHLYNSSNYDKNDIGFKGKVEFYLDRAIYRPGQTVYYKGIAVQKKKNQSSIVPNVLIKITVRDPNSGIFKEFEVTTNEFGSFSGDFVLPPSGLTGNFYISAEEPDDVENDTSYDKKEDEHPFWDFVDFENSTINFKVEEYKRPKFEVTFEPKKETFQVNQNVAVKGVAKAFSGSSISDAKVSYTITRFTDYYNNYYGNEQSEIIATSETKTDAFGKFVIDFIAQPSKNSNKEQLPVFNYRIETSVTDSNGETHTAQTIIKVGYHDLILKTSIPNRIETRNKNEITLNSTNLNGEFKRIIGELKLYFVSPLRDKFKYRVFQQPEINTITDADFEKLFPYEVNDFEALKKPKEILLFSKKIDTEKDKKLVLDFISNYLSGNYKMVFTAKDSFDNLIETTSVFEIILSKNKFNPNSLFTIEQINQDPKKDGFVSIQIRSVIDTLYIHSIANYKNSTFFEGNSVLENHQAVIRIPVEKDFEKSLQIGFESVFENQTFINQLEVVLKTDEPKMAFQVTSFRNKVEPGSTENWSFQLNTNNTKQEAEVLASMYDSSLDQFTRKDWGFLLFSEYNNNYISFRRSLGFEKTDVNMENLNLTFKSQELQNEKIQLKWFGFNINHSIIYKNTSTLNEVIVIGYGSKKRKDVTGAISSISGEELRQTQAVTIEEALQGKVSGIQIRGNSTIYGNKSLNPLYVVDGVEYHQNMLENLNPSDILSIDVLKDAKAMALYGSKGENGIIIITTKKAMDALTQVKARKNLSETVFFYPHLKTDNKGKVSFNFISPEALTAWKLRLLAHNNEAVSGYLEKSVVTQKELMIVPNFPRFLREKDSVVITAKVVNMSNEAKIGMAVLQFFDAVTMQSIDVQMTNLNTVKDFNITAHGNTTVSWKISIPEGLQGVQYKVLAKSGHYTDGEENILPVLTNSMLVTESIPVWVRKNSRKEYIFENLQNNTSATLRNHQFILEYTSNPTWLAIQSLPYLMEYEHECAEQTFSRFYANALAREIINSNPKIASVFESWKTKDRSKLEENEELKSIILAETPWFNDSKSEAEKKQYLATLFDLEKMKASQEAAFQKLKQKQKTSGGFAWFDGGQENEYISRHILAGLGHLSKLTKNSKLEEITKNGISFLDRKFLENHSERAKKINDKLILFNPSSNLHYLYTRSFYLDSYPLSDTLKKVTKLYLDTVKKDWLSYSLYEKGLAALASNRFGEKDIARRIIQSLKETASNNEDWGMYWIANKASWFWNQAPIETQALLIEAFLEVENDTQSVDAMKVWLLKNKQTKNWSTTKATTEAVYALLVQGTDWVSVKDNSVIKMGEGKILTKKVAENEKEAQTGYVKLNWKADEIKKDMAMIVIENKSEVPVYGGVYWQYFENLDKIKGQRDSNLLVSKELYLKKTTLQGYELQKITANNNLKIGDLVTVRLVISAKEDMEFVHLKDMRASCFEPVNVLSIYEYKSGLGYYISTRDAATNFFFDYINKGTYVLEYDIRVNNLGDFSNGISTIQSMYAPEFASHTKGIRVHVKE